MVDQDRVHGQTRSDSSMELIPVVYEISSRMSDKTLKKLSQTSLWSAIVDAARHQLWWHARCEYLVGSTLTWREDENWADVYRSLLHMRQGKSEPRFTPTLNYSNPLLISVLLELGADPIRPTRVCLTHAYNRIAAWKPLRFVVRDGNPVSVSRILTDPRIEGEDLGPACAVAITADNKQVLDLLLWDSRMTDKARGIVTHYISIHNKSHLLK